MNFTQNFFHPSPSQHAHNQSLKALKTLSLSRAELGSFLESDIGKNKIKANQILKKHFRKHAPITLHLKSDHFYIIQFFHKNMKKLALNCQILQTIGNAGRAKHEAGIIRLLSNCKVLTRLKIQCSPSLKQYCIRSVSRLKSLKELDMEINHTCPKEIEALDTLISLKKLRLSLRWTRSLLHEVYQSGLGSMNFPEKLLKLPNFRFLDLEIKMDSIGDKLSLLEAFLEYLNKNPQIDFRIKILFSDDILDFHQLNHFPNNTKSLLFMITNPFDQRDITKEQNQIIFTGNKGSMINIDGILRKSSLLQSLYIETGVLRDKIPQGLSFTTDLTSITFDFPIIEDDKLALSIHEIVQALSGVTSMERFSFILPPFGKKSLEQFVAFYNLKSIRNLKEFSLKFFENYGTAQLKVNLFEKDIINGFIQQMITVEKLESLKLEFHGTEAPNYLNSFLKQFPCVKQLYITIILPKKMIKKAFMLSIEQIKEMKNLNTLHLVLPRSAGKFKEIFDTFSYSEKMEDFLIKSSEPNSKEKPFTISDYLELKSISDNKDTSKEIQTKLSFS